MKKRFHFIHALIIIAIVMVGISPACAFISGKSSVIQICAADGSLQNVEVDEAFDPFAEPIPVSTDHLEALDKCPFCFASSHQKYGEAQSLLVSFDALPRYLIVSGGTAIPLGSSLSYYHPRGPPSFS